MAERDGGLLRDARGRRVLKNVPADTPPATTDVLMAGTLVDAEGREIVSLDDARDIVFADYFTGANATITSEAEYFATNTHPVYGLDTGVLLRDNNQGYTEGPNLRLFTQRLDFEAVAIEVDITVNEWFAPGATDYAGVKIWTRRVPYYQGVHPTRPVSAHNLPAIYVCQPLMGPLNDAASLTSSTGKTFIQKKQPQVDDYTILAQTAANSYPVVLGQTYHVVCELTYEGTAVRHRMWRDGVLISDVLDDGTLGGAAILGAGAIGIRGDAARFHFDNLVVRRAPGAAAGPEQPVRPPAYTLATLPPALRYTGGIVYVSDAPLGQRFRGSDGKYWEQLAHETDFIAAQDTFTRTVTDGMGTADIGGTWIIYETAADFDVDGTKHTRNHPSAATDRTSLLPIGVLNQTAEFTWQPSVLPAGQSLFMFALLRMTAPSQAYRMLCELNTSASVRLRAGKIVNSVITNFGADSVPWAAGTYSLGQKIRFKSQAIGSNPTTLNLKAWVDGTTEPTGWQFTATDSDSVLQTQNASGLYSRAGSGMTSVPIVVSIDDYTVRES